MEDCPRNGAFLGETVENMNLGIVNTPNTGKISGKKYTGDAVGYYDAAKSRIVIQ